MFVYKLPLHAIRQLGSQLKETDQECSVMYSVRLIIVLISILCNPIQNQGVIQKILLSVATVSMTLNRVSKFNVITISMSLSRNDQHFVCKTQNRSLSCPYR